MQRKIKFFIFIEKTFDFRYKLIASACLHFFDKKAYCSSKRVQFFGTSFAKSNQFQKPKKILWEFSKSFSAHWTASFKANLKTYSVFCILFHLPNYPSGRRVEAELSASLFLHPFFFFAPLLFFA